MARLSLVCVLVTSMLCVSVSWAADKKRKAGPAVVVPKITDIDIKIQTSDPPNLKLKVTGQVPTGGYTKPKLTRAIYIVPPADGVQDYFFSAVKPTGVVTQAITSIKAADTWKDYTKEAPWLKGIRVHGVGDGVKEVLLKKK